MVHPGRTRGWRLGRESALQCPRYPRHIGATPPPASGSRSGTRPPEAAPSCGEPLSLCLCPSVHCHSAHRRLCALSPCTLSLCAL